LRSLCPFRMFSPKSRSSPSFHSNRIWLKKHFPDSDYLRDEKYYTPTPWEPENL
jgi:hypothetical protein